MALADDLIAVIWSIRSIPGQFGLRPHTVQIINRFAYGQHTGDVDLSSATPLVEHGNTNPKVRWLDDEALAVGGLPSGTVEIGPITPKFDAGGTALATLDARNLDTGDSLHLLITGPKHPSGALYKVVRINADRAMHYMLRATPVSENQD